jgi:MinD-like ATPase involved in chromosome partitioning or flagellar assembly
MSQEIVRVVIADDLKLQRRMMRAAFEVSERFHIVGEASTGAELVQISKREQPDVVLTDLNMPVLDGDQALRILSFSLPQAVFIVFTSEEDIERLRGIVSAGASDFLRKPLQMNKLLASVEGIYDREAPRKRSIHGATPLQGAQILNVVGPQAGSGATTFAVNLAVALVALHKRVILLDLDFQAAAVRGHLGLKDAPGLLDLLQNTDRINMEELNPYLMVRHGLRVLPGTPFPVDAIRRDPEILHTLISVISATCDYVVVDLEPRMDETNRRLIGQSNRVYLTVPNDSASLAAAAGWMQVYQHTRPPTDKLRLIYMNARSDTNIPGVEVARSLGTGLAGQIEYDGLGAQMAYRDGKPAVLDGETKLGRSFRSAFEKLAEKSF